MNLPASGNHFERPADNLRIDLLAQWFSRLGAAFCGLLVLAIVAITVLSFNLRPAEASGGMFVGMAFIVFLPIAAVPVGLFCLVASHLSAWAFGRHSSPSARTGLWLSLGGPVVVIACYAGCFGIMVTSGVW